MFIQGQSGNPGGRPKKRPITDRLHAMSELPMPAKVREAFEKLLGSELPKSTTMADGIVLAGFLEGMKTKGGTPARKEIREAMEGKAPQRVEIQSPADRKIEIEVRYTKSEIKNPAALEMQENISVGVSSSDISPALNAGQVIDIIASTDEEELEVPINKEDKVR